MEIALWFLVEMIWIIIPEPNLAFKIAFSDHEVCFMDSPNGKFLNMNLGTQHSSTISLADHIMTVEFLLLQEFWQSGSPPDDRRAKQ